MPSALPDGEPVPADGALPAAALVGAAARPLGVYLHVPYCATRCGYCDFNTYTATELRGTGGVLASRDNYADMLIDELRLARKVLGDDPREVRTVFVGGGTPTLLAAADLVRMLAAIRDEFGLAADAEVTTEANPESVDPAYLAALREGGFNRISFGMQSARQDVLRILDRTHTPGRPEACVAEARAAGFEHVNLDLIYGTPGESDDDWRASLDAALGAGPDHVSAYALIVEEGTRLARRIRRGEIPPTDDDVHADRYLIAEQTLSAAGYAWYEVSNWATSDAARCLHNELYWRGADWWGAGPGAHSHTGGVRWWNVKHPGAYAAALAAGRSPGAGRELLTDEDRRVERILLELRLSEGVPWRTGSWRRGPTTRAVPSSPCGAACWRTRWSETWSTDHATPAPASGLRPRLPVSGFGLRFRALALAPASGLWPRPPAPASGSGLRPRLPGSGSGPRPLLPVLRLPVALGRRHRDGARRGRLSW